MKANIHPKYIDSKITCSSCGNVIETKSTKGDILVEICSNCHPFYTDKARTNITTGRVDKFKKKYKMK
jgi:large subunit ribosomal protein L31